MDKIKLKNKEIISQRTSTRYEISVGDKIIVVYKWIREDNFDVDNGEDIFLLTKDNNEIELVTSDEIDNALGNNLDNFNDFISEII